MRFTAIFILFFFLPPVVFSQDEGTDYTWWNQLHNWHEGDPGWRNWIVISPGFLGPNALPVPEVKSGLLAETIEAEITVSNHFSKGDPTKDISGRFYYPFARNSIAIEVYGVVVEYFAFSEEIRNERFSRIEDGKGFAAGDLYFSTLVQLSRGRKFPNTLLRMATKTASGSQLEGARFTDSPGYFFDLSCSKDLILSAPVIFRPLMMAGFYSWQTNDELNLQNDAFLYGAGAELEIDNWLLSSSVSGYSGYKNQRDRPVQWNVDVRKDWENTAFRFRFIHGFRDYDYNTFRFSFIWKMN
ncbi:MAG: hypothetical protein CSA36_05095 [Draconibacterium sp.]|nr:MAG: hypothetical protein CSA36_05095 [Draconibacterium sp.]